MIRTKRLGFLAVGTLWIWTFVGCESAGEDDLNSKDAEGSEEDGGDSGKDDDDMAGGDDDGKEAYCGEGKETSLCGDGCGEFVKIAAGEFMMGSPATEQGRNKNEAQHKVTLTYNFEIQNVETTEKQFSDIMGYIPSERSCGEDFPVSNFFWDEILDYCNALSRTNGFEECFECQKREGAGDKLEEDEPSVEAGKYAKKCRLKTAYKTLQECSGYRPPTEAEWEYAARAGSKAATYNGEVTAKNCVAPDKSLDEIAWHCGNSNTVLHPVGRKKPNEWELYDMLGNVSEFVWGDDKSYEEEEAIDPFGEIEDGAPKKVYMRGGSFSSDPSSCRAAFRKEGSLEHLGYGGFRPVRSLKE